MKIEVGKNITIELEKPYLDIVRYLGQNNKSPEASILASTLMSPEEAKKPLEDLVSKRYLGVDHQNSRTYYFLTKDKGHSLYWAIQSLDGLKE